MDLRATYRLTVHPGIVLFGAVLLGAVWATTSAADGSAGDRTTLAFENPDGELIERRISEAQSPALEQVLASSDLLWAFLIDPVTPYFERMAAAERGAQVFDLSRLPVLEAALFELISGPETVGTNHATSRPAVPPEQPGTKAKILGSVWVAPDRRPQWPILASEHEAAPWPWQIHQAFDRLRKGLHERLVREPVDRSGAWAAIADMKCSSAVEIRLVVRALEWLRSVEPTESDWPGLRRVLGNLREMGLRGSRYHEAAAIPRMLAELPRRWHKTQGRWVAHALLLDLLENSRDEKVRAEVIRHLPGVRSYWSGASSVELTIPAEMILALAAWTEKAGKDVVRRYQGVRALSIALDAPFRFDVSHPDLDSPTLRPKMQQFTKWFELQRPELEVRVESEAAAVDAARSVIPQASHCRG